MNRQHAYQIAIDALLVRRESSFAELLKSVGTVKREEVTGPNGETYFLEVAVTPNEHESELTISATVDLGSSYKLERIEESFSVSAADA